MDNAWDIPDSSAWDAAPAPTPNPNLQQRQFRTRTLPSADGSLLGTPLEALPETGAGQADREALGDMQYTINGVRDIANRYRLGRPAAPAGIPKLPPMGPVVGPDTIGPNRPYGEYDPSGKIARQQAVNKRPAPAPKQPAAKKGRKPGHRESHPIEFHAPDVEAMSRNIRSIYHPGG